MNGNASDVSVVVAGREDLVTTSLVTALGAHGMCAKRAAVRPRPPVSIDLAHRPVGVLVVDLHRIEASVEVVADSAAAGWSVLVINHAGDPARAAAAVAAGAAGTVSRAAPLNVLVKAVSDAAGGRELMTEDERAAWLELDRSARAAVDARRRLLATLTNRELEVLQQLERGRRAMEIASDCFVAISTVRTQIRSILGKLGVNSQQKAVALYRATAGVHPGRPAEY